MELAVNIKYLSRTIGIKNAAKVLSEAGFKYMDYTPELFLNGQKQLSDVKEIFQKNNLSVYQTHAPFNRYKNDDVLNHKILFEKALEATSELNAKYMVVHGDEYDFENNEYTQENALLYNYNYFAPIVEKACKLGINIAFENVFNDISDKPRYCSMVEELNALVDKYNSKNVCVCWDFGHAAVSYKEKQYDAIKVAGKRICCTHVHDNYLYEDTHLVPFMGKINWQECITALKQYCNTDVLSFEFVYGNIPNSVALEYSYMLYKIGMDLKSI